MYCLVNQPAGNMASYIYIKLAAICRSPKIQTRDLVIMIYNGIKSISMIFYCCYGIVL